MSKFRILRLLVLAVALNGLTGVAAALPTTPIQDTLFNADGSKASGAVTVSWKAFTASDGSTVASSAVTVPIVQGILSMGLTPNENATPSGTSYQASYLLDNGISFKETWVIPASGSPVTVSQIRVISPPPTGTSIAQSQVTGLVAALNGKAEKAAQNIFTAPQVIQANGVAPSVPHFSLREEGGSDYVGFRIPSLSGSTLYTLPGSDGLPGQKLTTDGAGSLFWSAAGSGEGLELAYEIFQNSGTSVTQRNVANFLNGLQVSDNVGQTRTEVQPVYGTTAGTITQGNDSRLSNARTPLAHAASHASGGADPVTPGSIGALKNTNDVIFSTVPTAAGLSVRSAAGQTASVQDWRDNAGNILAVVSAEGSVFVREMGVSAKLGGTVASQFFIVDGLNRFALSGFPTVLNFSRYDDTGVFKDHAMQILRSGNILLNTSVDLSDTTPTTGATKLSVKAGQGQGSTSLQEWKNNAGAVLSNVDANGNMVLNQHYVELSEVSPPATPATDRVRLFLDASSGQLMVRKDNGSSISLEALGASVEFHDAEAPTGTINGVNDTFTLAVAPVPPESLQVVRNGIVLREAVDFNLTSNTITFLAGAIPQTGDELSSWYRSTP